MSGLQSLKAFISQRLTAAVDDILGHLERTFREYEEETERLVQPTDIQQLWVRKEVQDQENQENQEDQEDPEPPHIKEEQEELCISQEADFTNFNLSPVPVKTEYDEEKAPSSQLHHWHTEDNGDSVGEPEPDLQPEDRTSDCPRMDTGDWDWSGLNSVSDTFSCDVCGERFKQRANLKLHMRAHTQLEPTDGDNCGGPEPTGRSDPGGLLHPGPAGLVTHTTHIKPFQCRDCGERFCTTQQLETHQGCHVREKPYGCWGCEKSFQSSGLLKRHMRIHTQSGSRPMTSSQVPRPIMPKAPEKSPLVTTPQIAVPAGQAVSLVRVVLPMPVVPDTNTGRVEASGKRRYRRTVAANTCHKCWQFRTAETGHSQYRGRVYCPKFESLPKHQWLQVMKMKFYKS